MTFTPGHGSSRKKPMLAAATALFDCGNVAAR
jgi:hypothetical protein